MQEEGFLETDSDAKIPALTESGMEYARQLQRAAEGWNQFLQMSGVDEKTVEEAKKIRDEAERKRAAAQEKYQEVRAQFETEEKALFGERYSREDEKQAEDRLAEYESLLAQKRSNLKKLQDAYRKTAEERAGGKSGFTENGTGRAVRAGTGNVSSGDTKAAVCGSGGIPGGEKMDRRLEADERSSKDV